MADKLKSIRVRLFLTLCITVIIIIVFLIIVNSIILERFYIYSKENRLLEAYKLINDFYNNGENNDISEELKIWEINYDFEFLITTPTNVTIYMSNQDFVPSYMEKNIKREFLHNANEADLGEKVTINQAQDITTGYNFIYLTTTLDNDYKLYVRVPIASIKESVKISNRFLQIIGCFTVAISGIVVVIISRRFTDPILQLNEIAKKISKLDFSTKYKSNNSNDEIDNLGKSINTMSETMEKTINQLRNTNIELEKDIEKKSKTDEMRKQFISDVSHELKTPIALIQGYAEGLIENVADDEESRKFYAEVILDESNKMDILVKKLLELIKIEYGELEFSNSEFDIIELIAETVRKSKVMLEEKNIIVKYDGNRQVKVNADEFYIEQIVNNYFTNAIKNAKEVNGKKEIIISTEQKGNITRISIFNTGDKIKEEDLDRIWKRFYKADQSRNREDGGTGIGLSLVKALMERMGKNYGVINKEDGVEFYFEI